MYTRTFKEDLSFRGIPLASGRHRIHRYPAMLHPHLVDFLIDNYAKKNDIVFDPFCGSGVTLLQSSIKQYESIGFDINPLSLLISKVKSTNFDIQKLKNEFNNLKNNIVSCRNIDIPDINNIDYWYKESVINDLGKIRFVLKNNNYIYSDFFIVCFAYTCRDQSLTRNGEFKRYRVQKEKIDHIENNVFDRFSKHIEDMIDIFDLTNSYLERSNHQLYNSEKPIDKKINYNLVITSPPYGDSRTTVAYGEYSSFGLEWTSDLNSFGQIGYKIDKESVGKVGEINSQIKNSEILQNTLEKIKLNNDKRAKDVLHFFNGYFNVLKNVVKNLNENGRVCFVVGNRTVGGVQIPMDQITADFFTMLGLNFENIFVRDILNKVMPLKNSPTNKSGVTKKTMLNEYIVIFRK